MSYSVLAIDPNKLKFVDAQLKTLNENYLKDLNHQLLKNYGIGANAAAPLYYNKTALMQTGGWSQRAGGLITSLHSFGGISIKTTNMSAFGKIQQINNSQYSAPNLSDYAIFYQLDKIKNRYWRNIGTNPPLYDNVEYVTLGHYYETENYEEPYITPQKFMGDGGFCIRSDRGVVPQSTHNYDDWLYLKRWGVYNRTDPNANRTAVTFYDNLDNNIYPTVLWDVQGIVGYLDKKPILDNGTYQGVQILNPAKTSEEYADLSAIVQMGEWEMINIYTDVSEALPFYFHSSVSHKSTLGDNIKLLGAINQTQGFLREWITSYSLNKSWYRGEQPYYSQFLVSGIAFKTEQDFLNLLGDWGVTRLTNNEETAKTQPAELFPGYEPDGGFVPGGGDSVGYDDDPTISNIPSFSDNTSDEIDVITPNVSSANAASVYALTLTATQSFLNWLITDSFIDNISNLFTDKLSALNDLKMFPFDIVNHDTLHTAATNTLTLANVSTEIACHKVQAGYNCILDGGNYHYTAYWGNFNDYTAATYYLYIPYGGIVELSPSHVVNCDLSIKYAIDIMTGNATAIIYSNGVFVKTVSCQMSQSVPITFTNTNQRDIKNALTAISAVNSIGGIVTNAAAGNVAGAVGGGLGLLGNVAGSVMTNPLKVGSVGSFSNSTAFAMPQNAFLIISRAQLSTPSGLNKIAGRPSNIFTKINSFVGSGFVKIDVSHINTAATTAEQNEIMELLRGGIFI